MFPPCPYAFHLAFWAISIQHFAAASLVDWLDIGESVSSVALVTCMPQASIIPSLLNGQLFKKNKRLVGKMCVFVSRPVETVTFPQKKSDHTKWVVDFLRENTHAENQSWKSSRISSNTFITTTATLEIFEDSAFFMFFVFYCLQFFIFLHFFIFFIFFHFLHFFNFFILSIFHFVFSSFLFLFVFLVFSFFPVFLFSSFFIFFFFCCRIRPECGTRWTYEVFLSHYAQHVASHEHTVSCTR